MRATLNGFTARPMSVPPVRSFLRSQEGGSWH